MMLFLVIVFLYCVTEACLYSPTNNTASWQSSKVVAKAEHLETDEDKTLQLLGITIIAFIAFSLFEDIDKKGGCC